MSESTLNDSHWRRSIRVLLGLVLSLLLALLITYVAYSVSWLKEPENYYLAWPWGAARMRATWLLMIANGLMLGFGSVWLRSQRDRDFHPAIIVTVFGLSLAAMFGVQYVAQIVPGPVGPLVVLGLTILAAHIRLRVPTAATRRALVIGVAVLLIGVQAWVVPKSQEPPNGLSMSERDAWAVEHVGLAYVLATDHIKSLGALEKMFGPNPMLAPAKSGQFNIEPSEVFDLESDGTATIDIIRFSIDFAVSSELKAGVCRYMGDIESEPPHRPLSRNRVMACQTAPNTPWYQVMADGTFTQDAMIPEEAP